MNRNKMLQASALAGLLSTSGWVSGAVITQKAAELRHDATVAAVEKVMPSVVNVATARVIQYSDFYDRLLRDFYGWGDSLPREKLNSIGSGIIIDEDGWVMTNVHVLRRASRVEVKLWNGDVYEADPPWAINELSDVALLKLQLPEGVKLKAVKFAEEDDLLLGETVLALGNPFGLGGTVTRGILSSKNRRPAVDNAPLNYQDWLQTDAAINPGNSGGPLINLEGELIGLNVAVYREGQGIGFAIPVKQVTEALSQFCTPEVDAALWFGARAKRSGDRLEISYVQPRSPAAEAGLQEGQEIVEVNGKVPATLIKFNEFLCARTDQRADLKVKAGSEVVQVSVALIPFDELISKRLGLSVGFWDGNTGGRYGLPGQAGPSGPYITDVEHGGPAEKAGLKAGMPLVALGGQEVRNLLTVGTVVSATQPGDVLPIQVIEPQRVGGGFVRYRRWEVPVRVR